MIEEHNTLWVDALDASLTCYLDQSTGGGSDSN